MGILGSTLSIYSTLFARGSTAAAIRPVATSYMYSLLVITTCIIRRHVRPIVTVVACVVCVSVCWSRPRVLQKRLSRSRCRLRRGLWSRMSHVLRGVWVHPRKMTLWGSYVGMPICGILACGRYFQPYSPGAAAMLHVASSFVATGLFVRVCVQLKFTRDGRIRRASS